MNTQDYIAQQDFHQEFLEDIVQRLESLVSTFKGSAEEFDLAMTDDLFRRNSYETALADLTEGLSRLRRAKREVDRFLEFLVLYQ